MKHILKMCWMVLMVVLFSAARNPVSAQETSVSYQTFYDDLSPYGQWIDYPEYGYVWHPYINDFRPYSSGGHWIWTDEFGWMWASDYDWGWAPFHYGRWLYDDFYGWVWVPGYEWSPAWVEWRTGGDYYGWAPLGPGINIGVNFSFGAYSPPYNYWCFVPRNYIMSPRVYDYCVSPGRNTIIISRTTIINNYHRTNNVFVAGPRRSEVEKYAGRINPFVVRQASRPGRTHIERNTVNVFRPRVERNSEHHFTPGHFERYDRQNGNAFKDRNWNLVNNERKIEMQRNKTQNQGQRENRNVFQRRQQDINRQNEMRRQQEQRNIEQQQQKNRNVFERHQNEMRRQQEEKRQQSERNNMQQRQNQMKQQRQTEIRQQQRNNSFQKRQQQQNKGNNNSRRHGKHG